MKIRIIMTISALLLLITPNLFAHEGHDENPNAIKATHGGLILAGKVLNIEYIINGTEVKIYPLKHGGGGFQMDQLSASAKASPRKGKPYEVVTQKEQDHFKVAVDMKGSPRVQLDVQVNVDSSKKSDHFKLQIEQQ